MKFFGTTDRWFAENLRHISTSFAYNTLPTAQLRTQKFHRVTRNSTRNSTRWSLNLVWADTWLSHFGFLVSPHGIAMPKGLYFTAVVFYLFHFFRRLISEVTERISTKLGHIFTYDCYLKNVVWTPRAFTPTGWGQKTHFGTDWILTEHFSTTEHDICK